MALAKDDDLHVGQHHLLHHHLSAAEHSGLPTGEADAASSSVHLLSQRVLMSSFFCRAES